MHMGQVVVIVLAMIMLCGMGVTKLLHAQSTVTAEPLNHTQKPTSNQSAGSLAGSKVCVDIKGAVKRPGVYHLRKGSRVEEALAAAGGSTDEADLKQVNLAKELMDQQIVQIPKNGEQLSTLPSAGNANAAGSNAEDQDKVNLNTASKEDLTKIDGIGDKKADKILEFRNQHGGFKSPDDLKNISGFGDKTVAKLKDHVSV